MTRALAFALLLAAPLAAQPHSDVRVRRHKEAGLPRFRPVIRVTPSRPDARITSATAGGDVGPIPPALPLPGNARRWLVLPLAIGVVALGWTHGGEPGDSATSIGPPGEVGPPVVTAPEPQTWMLLAVALTAGAVVVYRRQQ